MKKISLLWICFNYPPLYSGASRQAWNLKRMIDAKFKDLIEITILSFDEKHVKSNKNDLIRIYLGKNIAYKLLAVFKLFNFILHNIKKFEIIHFHGLTGNLILLATFLKIFRKITIGKFTLLGDDDPTSIIRGVTRGVMKHLLFSSFDTFIIPNIAFLEVCHGYGVNESKFVNIPNGVDTERFSPESISGKKALRSRLGFAEEDILLCYVGPLESRKGVDMLIEVFNRLKMVNGIRERLKLILVGPLRESSIGKIIEGSPAKGDISVVGFTNKPEQYMKVADIFVLLSRKEGLPNALLEAMSCGLACVILNEAWSYALFRKGNGKYIIMVPPNIEEIYQVLCTLIYSPDVTLKLGKNARDFIITHFSISKIVLKLIALYYSLLKRKF